MDVVCVPGAVQEKMEPILLLSIHMVGKLLEGGFISHHSACMSQLIMYRNVVPFKCVYKRANNFMLNRN